MPLVTAQGFNLTPQIGGGNILQNVESFRRLQALGRQEEQAGRGEQIQQALAGIQPQTQQQQQLAEQSLVLGGEQPEIQPRMSEAEMMERARQIDPALAKQQFKALGMDTESKRAEASRFATEVMSLPPRFREQKIMERAQTLQAQGRDPKDTLQLADMSIEEQDRALQGVQLLDLATRERLTAGRGAELTAGQKEFESLIAGMTPEEQEKARRIKAGLVSRAGTRTPEMEAAITTAKERAKLEAKIAKEKELDSERLKNVEKQLKIDERKFKTEEARQQAISVKNVRRKEAENAASVISNLLTGDRFSAGFGKIVTAKPDMLKTQEELDVRAEIDQVVNLIGLEARQKLKGQGTVSDSEAAALAKSATALSNPLLSDKAARKELRRVRDVFDDAAARNITKGAEPATEPAKKILKFNPATGRLE